jgi:glyoxylase-like metal-dependent hydrolase (beta-lactamase superfamily II)
VFLLDATPSDVIYVLVVEQTNGVVVIEPGFFDLKGEAIIDWISENIPDKPITHIIATHAHMDHGGGVRPYVAAGAKLIVHENAKGFFEKVLSRPASKILPDALDRNPRQGEVLVVSADEPLEISDEIRPVVVYPVENGHTTDMVMIMVANEKVLYSGDLYVGALARYAPAARRISPAKQPTSTIELYDAIQLYQLDVETLVGSHSKNVVKYEEFEQFMGK